MSSFGTKGTGLEAALAYAKVISENGDAPLTIKFGPEISYNPATGEMILPGVPGEKLPPDVENALRAFHGHESSERGFRKIPLGEIRARGQAGEALLLNAQGDAMLDKGTAERYPGLGMHIKEQVAVDAQFMQRLGPMVTPSMRSLSSVVRHIATGVTTYVKAYNALPQMRPYLARVEDELRNLETDDEQLIFEQVQRIYRKVQELEEVPDPPEGGEGDEDGEGEGEGGDGLPLEAEGDWDHETTIKERLTAGLLTGQLQRAEEGNRSRGLGNGNYGEDVKIYTFHPDTWVIAPARYGYGRRKYEIKRWERDAQILRDRLAQALTVQAPRMRRRLLKGEVDERHLHRLCIGEADVMKRKLKQETDDVAVYLSMDMSGSMEVRIDVVRHMVRIWIDALGRLGIEHAVSGWDTGLHGFDDSVPQVYRDAEERAREVYRESRASRQLYRTGYISHMIVKEFNDRYDAPDVIENIHKIEAGGGTPSAEGLLYAIQQIAGRKERRKIIFYMTDGRPAITVNGPEYVHRDYMQSLVKLANGMGIEIIPVALGTELLVHSTAQLMGVEPASVLKIASIADIESKMSDRLVGYLRKEALEQIRRR